MEKLLNRKRNTEEITTFFDNIDEVKSLDMQTRIIELYNYQKQYGLLMIDPLFLEDIKWFITQQEHTELVCDKYYPNNKITINMPKGKFAFRPVSYILPIDKLIYYSIVDKILFRKRDWISPYVYSNVRETNGKQVFNNPVKHWLRMKEQLTQSAKKDVENSIMINCDISGYFENIKIEKLLNELEFFCGRNEKKYKNKLKVLLDKWKYAMSQGLLQPSEASSLLGKYYLNDVDSTFRSLGKKYARYVDEFYFIENSERVITKNMLTLNEKLRELGLNINSSKTSLFYGGKIIFELESNMFFKSLEYAYHVKDFNLRDNLVNEKIEELYKSIKNNIKIDPKEFRRCTRILKNKDVPYIKELCLEMLKTYPEQTVDIVQYLAYFICGDPSLQSALIAFIRDESTNHYTWQNYWILICLMNLEATTEELLSLCDSIFKNKNQNDLIRSAAFLLLSKHLAPYQLKNYENYLNVETSIMLKRVMLVGLTNLPKDYMQQIFQHEDKEDISLYITKEYCRYLNDHQQQIKLPDIRH